MTLVVREDLSLRDSRKTLSKSWLVTAELCGSKAWHELNDRRPILKAERVVFGSALDAAMEQAAIYLRADQPVQVQTCLEAAMEVSVREELVIDLKQIEKAVTMFVIDVAGNYDWSGAVLQHAFDYEHPAFGHCNSHPDVVLPRHGIYDVKATGGIDGRGKERKAQRKSQSDVDTGTELAFYTLLWEYEMEMPVAEVGYWVWVRNQSPYWQVITTPVTDEYRRAGTERVLQMLRARNADRVLNSRAETPQNWTFPTAAKYPGLCADCQYNPANGGPCRLAYAVDETEEVKAAA